MNKETDAIPAAALEKAVARAVLAVDGVAAIPGRMARWRRNPGYLRVRVRIDRHGAIRVRLRIQAWFGCNVVELGRQLQQAVLYTLGRETTRPVADIDVLFGRFAVSETQLTQASEGRTP